MASESLTLFLLLASESERSDAAEEPDEELPSADEEREDELEEPADSDSADEALDDRALRRLVRERLLCCSFVLDSESPLDSPPLLLLPEFELELSEELLPDRELLVSLELLPPRPGRPLLGLCCCRLCCCLTPLGLPVDEDRLRL